MIKFKLKSGEDKIMSLEEMARWCCLMEAITSIENKCEDFNKNMDNIDWIKPLAFKEYIDARYHAMLHDVKVEHAAGII